MTLPSLHGCHLAFFKRFTRKNDHLWPFLDVEENCIFSSLFWINMSKTCNILWNCNLEFCYFNKFLKNLGFIWALFHFWGFGLFHFFGPGNPALSLSLFLLFCSPSPLSLSFPLFFYWVYYGFRLTKRDDYFWVNFNHF
jgi:hypothetical protein